MTSRPAAKVAEPDAPLRIAVIAAFPFPLELGSQIYVQGQLRELARAGAAPTLVCYGSGNGRATNGLDIARVPRWLSPRRLGAGPNFWKPASDLALIGRYVDAHRSRRFDLAVAHNGEAALAALAARPWLGVPVIYVAHTLLAHELPLWGPPRFESALAAAGARLDRELARRSDGVIALCDDAAVALRADAGGPFARIPPGLARRPEPSASEQQRVCRRFHLEPGRFVLYSGNLERYQGLDFLGEAAALAPELDVVVATHGRSAALHPALRVIRVVDRDEMRALAFAAQVGVVPRRAVGGFPIKLLGYMEAALPIVAFEGVADGLEHDVSARLLAPDAGPDAFAAAICGLVRGPRVARRLGDAARAQLEAVHDWGAIGAQTAAFARRVRDASTI